ncbi:MAG: PEPxxWA-CTERM sorting domain-containing protein [Sphingomonadaceae bacterium]
MTKYILGLMLAVSAACSPAYAVTVVSLPGSAATFAAPAGNVSTFNTVAPLGGGITRVGGVLVTGSTPTSARPAFSDNSRYLSIAAGQTSTLTSSIGFNTVSFFWGSIDAFNNVALLDASNNVIASYFGNDPLISSIANGDRTTPNTNRRVTFTRALGDAAIRAVRFQSRNNSFEIDNFVFQGPIPEPATWMMLLAGFGLVGASLRRRNRPLALI